MKRKFGTGEQEESTHLRTFFDRIHDEKRFFFLVVVFAFIIRVAVAVATDQLNQGPSGDEVVYNVIAHNILERGEFSVAPGELTSHRAPLYPLFLAAVYKVFGAQSYPVARILNALFGAMICGLVYSIGKRIFGDEVGVLGSLVASLDPFLIYYSYLLWTETLFILSTLILVFFFLRMEKDPSTKNFLLGGCLIAFSSLIRPESILLPPFLFLWGLIRLPQRPREVFAKTVVMILAMLAVMSPWIVRNSLLQKKVILTTTEGGYIFWQINNQETLDIPAIRGFWYSWPGVPNVPHTTKPDIKADPRFKGLKTEAEIDSRCWELGLSFVKENLRSMPRYIYYKMKRFFMVKPFFDFWPRSYVLVSQLWYTFLLSFFLLGVVIALIRRTNLTLIAIFFAAFFTKAIIFHINFRYRLQVEPFMILFASLTAVTLLSRILHRWIPERRTFANGNQ